MIRVEADSLDKAYSQAAKELGCSVTKLEVEILQNPSKGILGLFKKKAIISAFCVAKDAKQKNAEQEIKKKEFTLKNDKKEHNKKEQIKKEQRREPKNKKIKTKKPEKTQQKRNVKDDKKEFKEQNKNTAQQKRKENAYVTKTFLDDNFYKKSIDFDVAIDEINNGLNRLINSSCFEVEVKNVKLNDNSVEIFLDGNDAALLIGKEGYRYKAISYMLHNWINIKYNLNIRLEVAEFLKNQEEMIKNYLIPVKEKVNSYGKAQTKILDGVLIKIALEELRKEFPNKYVAIKSNRNGDKYIVVNEFKRQER